MARCEATTEAGKRCQTHALTGETRCIFHSKSERARKLRGVSRPKLAARRPELLRELTRDMRNVKNMKISEAEKVKLRSRLASQIHGLLNELDELDELRALAKRIKDES